jgi:hypothetical protein
MFQLPQNIICKIYEYDATYYELYKKVIDEISMFPIWNIRHIIDTRVTDYYYHLTIARNMINHWEQYHYTYFIDDLTDNSNTVSEKRYLINYLDTNSINSKISGRGQTLFEWIKYYNDIRSVR